MDGPPRVPPLAPSSRPQGLSVSRLLSRTIAMLQPGSPSRWGALCFPGNSWPCLETLFTVTTGGAYWHLVCVWGGRPGMRLDTPLHMGRPRPAT